ncbi:hypothetical protein [Aquimarina algiphila]|uniref:hypothetical protein n=1 Tax=Aquimarina algiphila TaxID=2047982 RepID=UPI00232CCE30|nr:hypothetical protein [Aquimarina algiphila]
MQVKKYVRYLFGIAFLVFVLNKFYLRPWVLDNNFYMVFKVIVLSIPNTIEAIFGTLIITALLLRLRHYLNKTHSIKDFYIYLIAVSIASLYVISQELKWHNLGGNNVFDINDVIASVIGLIGTYATINTFGFTEQLE